MSTSESISGRSNSSPLPMFPQQDHAWGVWYKVETGGLFGGILDVRLGIDTRLSISVCTVEWRRRVSWPNFKAGNVGKCGYYGLTWDVSSRIRNRWRIAYLCTVHTSGFIEFDETKSGTLSVLLLIRTKKGFEGSWKAPKDPGNCMYSLKGQNALRSFASCPFKSRGRSGY
jgi:hypothetical protein